MKKRFDYKTCAFQTSWKRGEYTNAFRLLNRKKGQSNIIAAVIFILLVIVAIVIIRSVVSLVTNKSAEDIDVTPFSFGADITSFSLIDNFTAEVRIKRSSGGENVTGVKFIFKDSSGITYYYDNNTWFPSVLETKIYIITSNSLRPALSSFVNIKEVSVYYVYKTDTGKEKISLELDTRYMGSGSGGTSGTSCIPDKDCNHYYDSNQCGNGLFDGCGNILNCSDCYLGEICNATNSCVVIAMSCTANSNCSYLNGVCGQGICNATNKCQAVFNSSTNVCRVSAGECDAVEKCTGDSANCPSDGFVLDYTNCTSDSVPCTEDICVLGLCKHETNDTKCGAGQYCDAALDCLETECSSCSDCELFFGIGCDYIKCKSCLGGCYYDPVSGEEDCVGLIDFCNSRISSCSDYYESECADDSCGVGADGCSWNGAVCVENFIPSFPTDYISYWKFESATDGIIFDEAGINNGILNGDALIFNDAEKGNVLSLDGEGDFVNLGDPNIGSGGTELSICAWINVPTNDITSLQAIAGQTGVGNDPFNLYIDGNDDISFNVNNESHADFIGKYRDGVLNKADIWLFVCGIFDGINVMVYLNTVKGATVVPWGGGIIDDNSQNYVNLTIGANPPVANFSGKIDDVIIFDRALSEEEIQSIYSAQSPGILPTCLEQGGDICLPTESCPGNIVAASDTTRCCNDACVIDNSDLCSDCGDGLIEFCDRAECELIAEGCYFLNGLFVNTCNSCVGATCTDYNADEITCNDNVCGISGGCIFDSGSCVECVYNTDCAEGWECLGGRCSFIFEEGSFFEDYINTDYISLPSVSDVTFGSGFVIPNGIITGELESEPTMKALFHLNGDEPYVHNPIYTRGSYDSSKDQRHAVWLVVKNYSRRDEWLFPDSGKFGNAYYLYYNSLNKYFNFPDDGIDKSSITFSLWIKSDTDFANHALTPFRIFGDGYNITLYKSADDLTLNVGGNYLFANDLAWKAGEWHHILVVVQSGNTQLWTDGILKASNTKNFVLDSSVDFVVGWNNNNLGGTGNILIDEFVIWDYPLSSDEIQALAQGNRINAGNFESNWIEMGESYNSLKASLAGNSFDNVKISFTCDDVKWEEIPNNQWANYRHYQLPCTRFKYKINFYGDADSSLDSIRFDWGNIPEDEDSFVFAFYGDSTEKGSGTEYELTHRKVAWQIEKVDPEITFHTGDMVDRSNVSLGSNETMWQSFLRTTEKLRERKSFGLNYGLLGSIGNHEGNAPYTGYFEALNYTPIYSTTQSQPGDNIENPEDLANLGHYQNMYYSLKYKGVCFISLYYYDGDGSGLLYNNLQKWQSRDYSPVDIHNLSTASKQYKWLYYTLEDCANDPNIKWKVVFFHNPPFGLGSHSASDDVSEIRARQVIRQSVSPLLEYFDVDLVDSGHDHLYVRTHPITSVYNSGTGYFEGVVDGENGIIYIDAASAGEDGDTDQVPKILPLPSWTNTWYGKPHFVKMTVTDTALIGEAINYLGETFDTFTITREVQSATCSDGVKNQDETQTDCGGICVSGTEICSDGLDNNNDCLIDEAICQEPAGDYYVDNLLIAGDCLGTYSIINRDCSGSDGNAYNTITEAVNVASVADVVLIRSGTYQESLRPANSGSPGNYITFKKYAGDGELIISGLDSSAAINLDGKSYIIVDGISADDVRRYVDATGASNTIVKNSHFANHQLGSFGMIRYFDNAQNNKFIDNEVSGKVYSYDENDLLIIKNSNNNVVEGNSFYTATHALLAVRCGSNNVIRNNYFFNDKNKIMEIYDCCEALLDNSIPTQHNVVEGNIFAKTTPDGDSSPEAGIQFAGQNTILRKNVFYEGLGGINLALYPGDDCIEGHYEAYRNYENRIYNNIFYSNHHGGILTGSTTVSEANFYDNIIKNNIFSANDLQLESEALIWWTNYLAGKPIQFKPGRLDGFVFENNNVVTPADQGDWAIVAGGNFAIENLPTGAGSVSWWQTNYPSLFYSNIESEPGFEDAANKDFRLLSSSAMIDAGAFLTTTTGAGSGKSMQVADARYFYDGFGILGEQQDLIQLEGSTERAKIIYIDYTTNTLTLDSSLTWTNGQGVSLAYFGSGPDFGAYEFIGPSPSPPLSLWQRIIAWFKFS